MPKININNIKKYLKTTILRYVNYKIIYVVKKYININYIFFGSPVRNVYGYHYNNNTKLPDLIKNELSFDAYSGMIKCVDAYNKKENFLREYLIQLENLVLEPRYGWAIEQNRKKLVYDSISYNDWQQSYNPSVINYFLSSSSIKSSRHTLIT